MLGDGLEADLARVSSEISEKASKSGGGASRPPPPVVGTELIVPRGDGPTIRIVVCEPLQCSKTAV